MISVFKGFSLFLLGLILANPLPVPIELVPRVEFWIKIFGEVSRNQRLIHHRWFPQCIFTTLDFTHEAGFLSKQALAELISRVESDEISRVKRSLIKIRDNRPLDTLFDLRVKEVVDNCIKKKRKDAVSWTLTEDLVRTQSGVMEKTRDAVIRSGRYLWYIEEVFKSYGIPDEIKYLPFVESSFNVNAVSKAGAMGMWQFMPKTGRDYGLRIDKYVDERRDPFKSTVAAAQYLRDAYQVFKSWPHALISYNHGVVGLQRKLAEHSVGLDLVKLIEHPFSRPLGFASTNFYPSFIAVIHVFKNYTSFFGSLEKDPPMRFTRHYLARSLSIYSLSAATGLSVQRLIDYNPQFSDAVKSGKLALPVHTLVYLPPGHTISYEKVPQIRKQGAKAEPKPKSKK